MCLLLGSLWTTFLCMDTRYICQLMKLIKAAHNEINRAQDMKEPPSMDFLEVVHNSEEEWSEAGRRFDGKKS